MSVDLVYPPPNASPETALRFSQQAPPILEQSVLLPWPLTLLSADDTQDKWTTYENLFVSCLRTGDDKSARMILDKLVARFGDKNERVMAYQGMWAEARVENEKDMVEVLKEYGEELQADPTNFPLQKRRIALLRSMNRVPEATQQLVDFLQVSPTDAEAWAELSDLYFVQNSYEQAMFCLEEVLLILPNAWNMHARLAEIVYLFSSSASPNSSDMVKGMAEAMRRYCRSIELCNNYLRGYYGLKLTSKRLLELLPNAPKSSSSSDATFGDLALPSISSVERLHELATSKLGEIIRRSSTEEKGWDGYSEAELIAARELLNRDSQRVER